MSEHYRASYYNLRVPDDPWTLLYNGVTSGLLRLPPDLSAALAPFLGHQRQPAAGRGRSEWDPPVFRRDDLPADLREVFDELLRGRFFVPAQEDEFEFLRRRTAFTRANEPFLVTITTTLDCNFQCYYCYEAKAPVYLSRERCDQILAFIRERVEARAFKKVYTDWYGGEPMLNRDAIEYFSQRAIAYCEQAGIGYSSALISNGTHWPEDARAFVERNRLNHVQLTLDGPARHHNTRRGFKPGHAASATSFDTVIGTLDRLVGATRVYLRINVDPGIGAAALELVDLFIERGWLQPGRKFYPYLAPIGPMTEHCGFLGSSPKFRGFHDDFTRLKTEFQQRVAGLIDPKGLDHLQIYPSTRRMNCAAVGENSVIFGPDGLMYKCGLDVGTTGRAFDALPSLPSLPSLTPPGPPPETTPPPAARTGSSRRVPLPMAASPASEPAATVGSQAHPYHTYDPYTHERCSQCQYLPACMGGCPKTWFEGNEFYLAGRSAYWEQNCAELIRTYARAARPHD